MLCRNLFWYINDPPDIVRNELLISGSTMTQCTNQTLCPVDIRVHVTLGRGCTQLHTVPSSIVRQNDLIKRNTLIYSYRNEAQLLTQGRPENVSTFSGT